MVHQLGGQWIWFKCMYTKDSIYSYKMAQQQSTFQI